MGLLTQKQGNRIHPVVQLQKQVTVTHPAMYEGNLAHCGLNTSGQPETPPRLSLGPPFKAPGCHPAQLPIAIRARISLLQGRQ